MSRLLGVVLALLLLNACGHEARPEVSVTARLSVCRGGSCVFVPAAGARVTVLAGGRVVRSGTADDAGRYVVRVPAGRYSATATMLGMTARSAAVDVADGGAASLDASFQPSLSVPLK